MLVCQPGPPARGQANALGGDGADAAGRGARILIVEDEAWGAELAQRLLTSAGLGFTAVVVETRESFVAQLTAFRPDATPPALTKPAQGAVRITPSSPSCPVRAAGRRYVAPNSRSTSRIRDPGACRRYGCCNLK
jgi:hypothetical protein